MALLRRRFVCFYCSRRSAKSHPADTRHWECQNCNAVNYLDEKGEITDPPASATQSDTRFAHSVPRPVSPELGSSEESLFCARCLTNQHLLTQTLASYLPPTTDPEYLTYEKSYPNYRKQLEERYPQVCQDCEPRVRERLRATGYAAKTDHLRRMVEQTRNGQGRRLRAWGWQDNVVLLAEISWWLSLLVLLSWHALNIAKESEQAHGLSPVESELMLPECIHRSLGSGPLESICASRYNTLAGYALLLALLSIWWNPQLRRKLKGNVGRMVGLTDYYKLQIVFITIRSAAWGLFTKSPVFTNDPQTVKAGHAFMLVFTIVFIIASYHTVYWEPTLFINFKTTNEPLLSSPPSPTSMNHTASPPDLTTQVYRNLGASPTQTPKARFDINSLAPTPSRTYLTPNNPPTPPTDDDDDDADTMDWTPSHTLPSATPYRPPSSQPEVPKPPNPFYGSLPPRPISQAHALRNPVYRPPGPLERASAQQENFFRRQPTHDTYQVAKQATRTPKKETRSVNGFSALQIDDDMLSPTTTEADDSSPRKVEFAQPRFFPKGDYENDTGLENLFGRVFSLRDQPVGVEDAAQAVANQPAAPPMTEQRTERRTGGRGIPGLEWRPQQDTRTRERKSLFRAEVIVPVVLLALVAQVWWFDVTRWGWLVSGANANV